MAKSLTAPAQEITPGNSHLQVSPKQNQPETNLFTAIFDSPWIALAESLREGVILVSHDLKPAYLNQQAKDICQKLQLQSRHFTGLPTVISQLCYQLIKIGQGATQPIIAECETAEGQAIRFRVSWVNLASGNATANSPQSDRQYILIFLENRAQILQEELQFEQHKYQLTDREMEIWSLLRQDYSYQEIAAKLHISLNTVKTHVKNIYAKRRWNQVQDTVKAS